MRLSTTEHHKVKDLQPWEQNPRKHDAKQIGLMALSIEHFGLGRPPIIQTGTRRILAGHGLYETLMFMGLGDLVIPCTAMDLSPEDCAAYTVADNRMADLSEWSKPQLREVLVDLDDGAFNIEVTGFTDADLRKLFGAPKLGEGGEALEDPTCDPEVYELQIEGMTARVIGPSKSQAKKILSAVCKALGYQAGDA